jgi:sulfite exporter TauE/SafE
VGGVVELAGSLVGVQRAASVVAGAVLVLEALLGLAGTGPLADTGGGRLFARVSGALGRRVPRHPTGLGLLLGLLPCGLLYSALIAAVARGGPLEGAAALLAFGVGTAPALLGPSLADELLARHRALLDRLARVFLLAMGRVVHLDGPARLRRARAVYRASADQIGDSEAGSSCSLPFASRETTSTSAVASAAGSASRRASWRNVTR